MAQEIHVQDIGTVFRATFVEDSAINISSASTKQFIFKKPSGTLLTVNGSFYTDGTDGILQYTTVSGDLNESGIWKLQGYVVIGSNQHHSDIYTFTVHANL